MNIVVKTSGGHCIVRPDTTWEKDSEDFFAPDFVKSVSFSPVIFAHVCKPGRSVGKRFASRYIDGIGFGILLYPDQLIDGTEEGYAAACCLDHISFLPYPMPESGAASEFVIKINDVEVFRYREGNPVMLEEAVAEATSSIYIRTGDLIAVELQNRTPLCDAPSRVTATQDGKTVLDFRIVI